MRSCIHNDAWVSSASGRVEVRGRRTNKRNCLAGERKRPGRDVTLQMSEADTAGRTACLCTARN